MALVTALSTLNPVAPNPGNGPSLDTTTLRKLIKAKTDQDVIRCLGCGNCNLPQIQEEMDVSVDSLIQMVLENDEDVLTTRTLWSDRVLKSIRYSCKRGLNLKDIFLALRSEAQARSLPGSVKL